LPKTPTILAATALAVAAGGFTALGSEVVTSGVRPGGYDWFVVGTRGAQGAVCAYVS